MTTAAWPIGMDFDPVTGWPICWGGCDKPVDPATLEGGICPSCRGENYDPATGWPICMGRCQKPVDPALLVDGLCAACRNEHPITGQPLCKCGRPFDPPALVDLIGWLCPTCGANDGAPICFRCEEVSSALLEASLCSNCRAPETCE
jgi:hypothetical protein